MSFNSSSSSNASSSSSNASSSSSTFFGLLYDCFYSTVGAFNMTAFSVTSIITILPPCIFVLYLGHQRWRRQRSSTTTSHSDIFTYHMVIIELMYILGSTLICCGVHADRPDVVMLGMFLSHINFCGQISFHVLTCVERYLAVVHPVTYLGLRRERGTKIRNISIGCVWLLCLGGTAYMVAPHLVLVNAVSFCVLTTCVTAMLFCNISVLCALIRPGPGEGGGDTPRVDQSKLRAFYTISAILGVLFLRVGSTIFATSIYDSPELGAAERCGLWFSELWFGLPSSLVLPLLFLHREGKLRCRKSSNPSGRGSD